MKLYVLRHGQTQYNVEKKFNGRFDEDINEEGIRQAEKAAETVKNLEIDLVICSPLKRTRHTCEIANVNKVPVIFDERLEERDIGVYTGKPLGEFYEKEYWNYNSTKEVEGLESIRDLFNRVKAFLDEIKEKYKDKNILLVTHGGVSRGIYFYFNEIPEDGMLQKYGSSNCQIKEYEL